MPVRLILAICLIFGAGAVIAIAAPAPGFLIDVPFVPQTKDGCGSASISMVMRYWEKDSAQSYSPAADPEKIQAALFSSTARGIPASMMRKYLQDSGYRVFAFQGEWQDLIHQIEKGRPVIVSLKATGPLGPLHYVVVVGIDTERSYVFVNDSAQQKTLRFSREGFESQWNPAHNWTLLAVPQSGI